MKLVLTEAAKNAIRMTAERTGSNEINTGIASDGRMPEDNIRIRPIANRPGHWELTNTGTFFRASFTKNTEKVWHRLPGYLSMSEICQMINQMRDLVWAEK